MSATHKLLARIVQLTRNKLLQLLKKTPKILLSLLNVAFAPKAHLKQLLLVTAVQLASSLVSRAIKEYRRGGYIREPDRLVQKLEKAASYEEWLAATVETQQRRRAASAPPREPRGELEEALGLSSDADRIFCEQLYMRAANYAAMQESSDDYGLMFHLRSELMRRQLGGVGYSRDGTKWFRREKRAVSHAIEQYQAHVCDALRYIGQPLSSASPRRGASSPPQGFSANGASANGETAAAAPNLPRTSAAQRLAFINETRHAYGRTALLLSGGGAFGVKHVGVIQALNKARLLPRILSGTSAGSIVAAFIGVKTDAEIDEMLITATGARKVSEMLASLPFFGLRRGESQQRLDKGGSSTASLSALLGSGAGAAAAPAQPPAPPASSTPSYHELDEPGLHRRGKAIAWDLRHGSRHMAQARTLLDSSVLCATLERLCGPLTFLEAFDRTGRILNIVVTRSDGRAPPLLCNYLTTPQLLVYSAALASCSIPGVFEAVELMAKDRDGSTVPYFKTGGFRFTDGGLQADLPKERLTELFNVNQFIVSQVNPLAPFFVPASTGLPSIIEESLLFLKEQLTGFVKGLSHLGNGAFIRPGGMRLADLALQEYEGTLTIYPKWDVGEMSKFLANFDTERAEQYLLDGARATWPQLELIHSLCEIEFTLDAVAAELQCAIRGAPLPHMRRPTSRPMSRGSSIDGQEPVGGLGLSLSTHPSGLRGKLPSYVSLAAYGDAQNHDNYVDGGTEAEPSPRSPGGSLRGMPARISSHAALYTLAAIDSGNTYHESDHNEPPASVGLATYQT